MNKEKPGVLILHKWRRLFDELTDQELRTVIYALIDYSENGVIPEFEDRALKFMFQEFMDVTDYNTEKWLIRRTVNSENGKKGGAPMGNKNAQKRDRKTTETSDSTNINNKINNNKNININNKTNIQDQKQDMYMEEVLDDLVGRFAAPRSRQ